MNWTTRKNMRLRWHSGVLGSLGLPMYSDQCVSTFTHSFIHILYTNIFCLHPDHGPHFALLYYHCQLHCLLFVFSTFCKWVPWINSSGTNNVKPLLLYSSFASVACHEQSCLNSLNCCHVDNEGVCIVLVAAVVQI